MSWERPWDGPRRPKTPNLGTWIRTPSGHPYEWDYHPLKTLRTQNFEHLTLELGCVTGHPRVLPDFPSTRSMLHCTRLAWDTASQPGMPPVTGPACQMITLLALSCKRFFECNLPVSLLAYWGRSPLINLAL